MNDPIRDEWHRLFSAALNDTATDDEQRQLAALLKSSAEARQLWFLYHDNECGLAELKQPAATSLPMVQPTQASLPRQTTRWRNWRTLSAAAAGLLIGLFSASVVFGFLVQRGAEKEKRTPLPVFEPSFENPRLSLEAGFPSGPGRWSGDLAHVVPAENGVVPKYGGFMLRLEPMSRGTPRIYQVLDLQSLPSGADADVRDIDISASFAAADSGIAVRYFIRAFAVTEPPDKLDASWFDRRGEESIAAVTRGIDVMSGTTGWQTFNAKIQVPRAARSLVLFFGVRTPDKSARMSPHYLDDVRVSLVTPPSP